VHQQNCLLLQYPTDFVGNFKNDWLRQFVPVFLTFFHRNIQRKLEKKPMTRLAGHQLSVAQPIKKCEKLQYDWTAG
jgi:hypothetical protein